MSTCRRTLVKLWLIDPQAPLSAWPPYIASVLMLLYTTCNSIGNLQAERMNWGCLFGLFLVTEHSSSIVTASLYLLLLCAHSPRTSTQFWFLLFSVTWPEEIPFWFVWHLHHHPLLSPLFFFFDTTAECSWISVYFGWIEWAWAVQWLNPHDAMLQSSCLTRCRQDVPIVYLCLFNPLSPPISLTIPFCLFTVLFLCPILCHTQCLEQFLFWDKGRGAF